MTSNHSERNIPLNNSEDTLVIKENSEGNTTGLKLNVDISNYSPDKLKGLMDILSKLNKLSSKGNISCSATNNTSKNE